MLFKNLHILIYKFYNSMILAYLNDVFRLTDIN